MLFALLSCCFGLVFFQFFSNLPLYYQQVYHLPKMQIGSLFALNGLVVFSLEMIIVYLVGNRYPLAYLITTGTLLVGLSFVLLNLWHGLWVLYLAMFILSMAEILAMPFIATISVKRSEVTNRGAYMGVFTLSYAMAMVLGPYLGSSIITHFGFADLWWSTATLATLTALGFYFLVREIE